MRDRLRALFPYMQSYVESVGTVRFEVPFSALTFRFRELVETLGTDQITCELRVEHDAYDTDQLMVISAIGVRAEPR